MDIYHAFTPGSGKTAQAPAPQITLLGYTLRTAWGRAALLAGVLLLAFLLLQGRRLGPSLPVAHELRRREAVEYVEAMARLKRRAHQRNGVARHQHMRLLSELAQLCHVDARLPADAFITALRRSDDSPSPEQLQRIERVLSGLASTPSEAELVHLAAEVDEILQQL